VRRLRADGINCLVRSTEPHEMAAAFWLSLTIWAYDASQLRLLQKSFWRCENKNWRPFCFKRAKRSSAYAMPFRMPPGLARTSCGHQRASTSLALVAKDTSWSRPSPLGDHVVEAKRQMKDAGSLYERRFKWGAWSADAMAQLIRSGCRDYPKTLVPRGGAESPRRSVWCAVHHPHSPCNTLGAAQLSWSVTRRTWLQRWSVWSVWLVIVAQRRNVSHPLSFFTAHVRISIPHRLATIAV
jgi:hypothetical protein